MVERLFLKQKIIVFGMGVILSFIVCFYGYSMFVSQEIYHIHFNGVNGLKEGVPVTYKGVEIGNVHSIKVELPEADLVDVVVKIKDDFPIYSNYHARLMFTAINGYTTIDLIKVPSESQVKLSNGDSILVTPYYIEELVTAAPEAAKQLNEFLKKLNASFDEKSLKNVQKNVESLSNDLASFTCNLNSNAGPVFVNINNILTNCLNLIRKFNCNSEFVQDQIFSKSFQLIQSAETLACKIVKKASSKNSGWRLLL